MKNVVEDEEVSGYGDNMKWMQVSDAEAYDMTRRLIREEGLTVGPVSGGVMAAAIKAAVENGLNENPHAKILVVLPDSLANSSHISPPVDHDCSPTTPVKKCSESFEDTADFINYKGEQIESHHLSEYGVAMSDGIPSIVWARKFCQNFQTQVITRLRL
ncbi:hypothetical protein Ocin01_19480 [Orchesella cincta]|uniref:Cystathionine beta-synthase n=1 Tax=Orchesella cincta TaxID=48709 RepID=A0A1D2M2L3_ORCCI|nr:hypothetical protein Ocin01_19480 [Orchesella cincta]